MSEKQNLKPETLSKKHRFYYLLWEMIVAGALIIWYGYFAYVFGSHFFSTYALSSLVLLIYELMLVFFLVIRHLPKEISFSPYDWTVAIIGTVGSTLLRPADVSMLPEMDFIVIVQIFGMVISAIGLASLARSYGTVAANRGVKTTGLYRYIRHPLYSGYFFTITAFLLQNTTWYNMAIVAMVFTFKLLRIFAEERLLMQDPEYAAYAQKTKYRIIPFIW